MTRLIASLLACGAAFLTVACVSDAATRDESHSYLEESRPACTQLGGSTTDPCERRDLWVVRIYPPVYTTGSVSTPDLPINIESTFRRMWDQGEGSMGLLTPQIVVRGIVLPNSSRCVEFRDYVLGLDDDGPGYSTSDYTGEVCYADISVSEYVVGTGPRTIPIVIGWRNAVPTDVRGYGTGSYYDDLAEPIEEMMGGFEFVIGLARPLNMAWGEWMLVDVWDVQRRSDGVIVGQHELAPITGKTSNVADYEFPMAELQRKIRDAHAKLSNEFGGKIGPDADDPKLVSDANRTFLLAQLRELGAYDIAGITPKPAP